MSYTLKRIWWIASYPKSGSTWVRMFVNAYVTRFPVNLNSAFQYATGDLQANVYQSVSSRPISALQDLECIYLRSAALLNQLHSAPSKDICLKTHHANVNVDGIPLIPPRLTKGVLCIVRDPRDVAVSFADHCGKDVDRAIEMLEAQGSLLLCKDSSLFHWISSWSAHVDSWTMDTEFTVTTVKYEDMLSDTDATFRRIMAGLGFPDVDEERFAFAMDQTRFEHLQELEDDTGFREKGNGERFFRQGISGGWKDVLTEEQINKIQDNHQHTMARFGYEPVTVAEELTYGS